MAEKINLEIPIELQRKMNDIMLDNPTFVYLGDSQFKIKGLRMYSRQRILDVGMRMIEKFDSYDKRDSEIIKMLATDIDAASEVVAIILCNHLFDADDCNSYEEMQQLLGRNDRLIEYMKKKVLLSTTVENQWAAIILQVLNDMRVEELFTLSSLVKVFTSSATMRRKKVAAEQLQSWQEAQSESLETS